MTRKDFELIAEAIAAADLTTKARESVIKALTWRLKSTNVNFDAGRFEEACYGEDNDKPRASKKN